MTMKITDLKCAVLGQNPVVRVVTDEGLSGYGEVEAFKPYLRPHVLHLKQAILGDDPTDAERVMLKIRRRGSFKPWGSAVSAIEMALWDVAGKAAGLPVYKLRAGTVRDRVRVYNGAVRFLMTGYPGAGDAITLRMHTPVRPPDPPVPPALRRRAREGGPHQG